MPKKKRKHLKKKTVIKKEKIQKKEKKTFLTDLKYYYLTEYKRILIIPILLFIISAGILYANYLRTGDFINRDVSLKGGITITINTDKMVDTDDLKSYVNSRFPQSSINIRTSNSYGKQSGIIVEASDVKEEGLMVVIEEKIGEVDDENFSVERMGSTLGASFFKEMFLTLGVAFFMMGLVFLYYFRSLIATFAALISAFFDIFITLGIITLLGVRLTSGGIASFLMLIGYSIDTSILISTKLLKGGSASTEDAIFGAMKTGFTMSAAGIAATGISFLLTNNDTLRQIMLILVIGLIIDLITTWIENIALLRIYLERKKNA